MRFRNMLRRSRTLVPKIVVAAAAAVPLLATKAYPDWVINGEVQVLIPFWYTLEEAICRYMIAWC